MKTYELDEDMSAAGGASEGGAVAMWDVIVFLLLAAGISAWMLWPTERRKS